MIYAKKGPIPLGPTGIQGGEGPIGPPMKDWMPPEQYKTMCLFMEGKLSFKELKNKAKEYLKEYEH